MPYEISGTSSKPVAVYPSSDLLPGTAMIQIDYLARIFVRSTQSTCSGIEKQIDQTFTALSA